MSEIKVRRIKAMDLMKKQRQRRMKPIRSKVREILGSENFKDILNMKLSQLHN